MTHTRIRPFNTRDTYPEQKLDNDLCQAVVAQGRTVVSERSGGAESRDGQECRHWRRGRPGRSGHAHIKTLLAEAGAAPEHICKVVIYITDPRYREGCLPHGRRSLKRVCFQLSTDLSSRPLLGPSGSSKSTPTAVIPD